MAYERDIQWFPGHMAKTRRMIADNLKLVDAVVEIVDSRIPASSRNPLIDELVGSKPRVLLLNKSDYSDDELTKRWREYYTKKSFSVLAGDCRSGKGMNRFVPLLKELLSDVLEKRRERGMAGRALRIMVVGIPNVGKSSFINRMANAKKTKVEDRPGVTRGKQWVAIDKDVELLDMPGILAPKLDDRRSALNLAFIGAIKDDIMDIEELAEELGTYLSEHYPRRLAERYGLDGSGGRIIEQIAEKRGMLAAGGEPDTRRAASALLDEYRSGKIGKITLEQPPEI